MAINNKDKEEMIDNDDLSINLDNLDLPEIPDFEDDFSDFTFQENQESNTNEVSELNNNAQDKTQSIDEIEVGQEIEDIELKPLSEENIQVEQDESTTLSNEELENILDVESIELKDVEEQKLEEESHPEEIKIEPIEIDVADDTTSISESPNLEELQSTDLDQDIPEESISLTEKELDDILGEGIQEESILHTETQEDDILKIQDEDLVKKIVPDSEVEEKEQELEEEGGTIETHLPPLSEVEAEDETISLTPEELEGIISNEEIEEISDQLSEEFDEQKDAVSEQELESIEIPEPIIEENEESEESKKSEENETISLTDDELHNILDDVTENISSEPTIPEPEIYEVPSENREQLADNLQKETGLKKEELKKIISYLDSLFDKLPEEAIREFSKSEYFNLYKKVIEVLEIYPKE